MFGNWTNMSFEERFGVWSMDMVFMNGLMEGFTKASGKRTKCMEKTLFIGLMAESIRESGETWKQHGFFITSMQNSKSRFLHGSNGLPNKANEKLSRWLLSCPSMWKTACQTVWGDGLRAGTEEFPPRFKS